MLWRHLLGLIILVAYFKSKRFFTKLVVDDFSWFKLKKFEKPYRKYTIPALVTGVIATVAYLWTLIFDFTNCFTGHYIGVILACYYAVYYWKQLITPSVTSQRCFKKREVEEFVKRPEWAEEDKIRIAENAKKLKQKEQRIARYDAWLDRCIDAAEKVLIRIYHIIKKIIK